MLTHPVRAGFKGSDPFVCPVTASSEQVPQPLLDQLAVGGRLVLPVGKAFQELQELVLYRRTTDGYERTRLALVRFVPLIRKDQSTQSGER